MAVKQTLEIQLTHVIVKCKEPAFAVPIVPVDVASAKKLYQDYNKFHSFFLFISKSLKFFYLKNYSSSSSYPHDFTSSF